MLLDLLVYERFSVYIQTYTYQTLIKQGLMDFADSKDPKDLLALPERRVRMVYLARLVLQEKTDSKDPLDCQVASFIGSQSFIML